MNFETFKRHLAKSIGEIPSQNVYRIRAKSMEEIQRKATEHFNIPLEYIRFEVEHTDDEKRNSLIKQGVHSVLAYPSSLYFLQSEQQEELKPKNGEAFVRKGAGTIYLMVTAPNGGKPVALSAVVQKINDKIGTSGVVERGRVKQVVDGAEGAWRDIGTFAYNPNHDFECTARISEDAMKAFIVLKPPQEYGADPMAERMRAALESEGVRFGISEDKLADLERMPVYNQWVEAAAGIPVIDEQDAKITLIDNDKKRSSGASPIISVSAGDIVAVKHSIVPGQDGRSVLNETIFPKQAIDLRIKENKYVSVSEDGLKAIAKVSGSAKLGANHSILIEELLVIRGDVSSKTGNIKFPGSVIIYGDVPDEYEVEVEGNLEVHGGVANAKVTVGQNLLVHRGINGKDRNTTHIMVKGSLIARFLESVTVRIRGDCIVEDGVIQSRIVCEGRFIAITGHGRVVNSDVSSAQLIQVREVGSELGGNSTLRVASLFDEREKMEKAQEMVKERQKQLKEVKLLIGDISSVKTALKLKQKGSEHILEKIQKAKTIHNELEKLKKIAKNLRDHFKDIKTNGKIVVESQVNSGTIITIDEKVLELKSNMRGVVFAVKDNSITHRTVDNRKDNLNLEKIKKNVFL